MGRQKQNWETGIATSAFPSGDELADASPPSNRRDEIAKILATGLVRLACQLPSEISPETSPTSLEVFPDSRLSGTRVVDGPRDTQKFGRIR